MLCSVAHDALRRPSMCKSACNRFSDLPFVSSLLPHMHVMSSCFIVCASVCVCVCVTGVVAMQTADKHPTAPLADPWAHEVAASVVA